MPPSTEAKFTEEGLIAELLGAVPHPPSPWGPGDDAACLELPSSQMVISSDILVESVHFLPKHPPKLLAQKALHVNLSDIAAMGVKPSHFLLSVALPKLSLPWLQAFSEGLGEMARQHQLQLIGGDTVRTSDKGPLMIQVTVMGEGKARLKRHLGEARDHLMVLGEIGRSFWGLSRWLKGNAQNNTDYYQVPYTLSAAEKEDPALMAHLDPRPPLWAGPKIADLGVKCAMDLSDGLAKDLPRLAEASKLQFKVHLDALPEDPHCPLSKLSRAEGGEDYALLALCPEAKVAQLKALGFLDLGTAESAKPGEPPVLYFENGQLLPPPSPSFLHF